MIYRKNLPIWEQWARGIVGLATATAAVWLFSDSLTRTLLIAGGATFAITGVFGFCPMCAMVGRRPIAPSER